MNTTRRMPVRHPVQPRMPDAAPRGLLGQFAVDARTLLSAAQIDGVATLGYN